MSVVSGLLIEAAIEPFRCFSGLSALALALPFKTDCFFIVMFDATEAQILAFKILERPSHCMSHGGSCFDSIGTVYSYDASAIKLDIDSTMAIQIFTLET